MAPWTDSNRPTEKAMIAMNQCVRAGCTGTALAVWWQLCQACTSTLLEPIGVADPQSDASADQASAAGFDAVNWAERISPSAWGHAAEDDAWVNAVRCLALASVVTGRSSGCAHTSNGAAILPVIAIPRAAGALRCPACAEPVVATATVTTGPCDRCAADGPLTRIAAITGQSLIIVASVCQDCARAVLGSNSLTHS